MALHESYIKPSELSEFREYFPRLLNRKILKFVSSLLNRLSRLIGYPIYIAIPENVLDFKGNNEALRAIRITNQLLEQGIFKHFYTIRQTWYSDEPNAFMTLVRLTEKDKIGMSGKSTHLWDSAATLWPALGEAMERYCIRNVHLPPGEPVDSSWRDLHQPKADIFDIASLDSECRMKGHRNFKLNYDENTVFRWVKATELTNQSPLWAPLQWFSFNHVQTNLFLHHKGDMAVKEPMISVAVTTGSATGQTTEDAVYQGLCEVIERDAFMIYWLNQIAAEKIDPTTIENEEIKRILEIAREYRLEINLLYLKTDVPIHTVCSVLLDRTGTGQAVMLSAKTGYDLEHVISSLLQDTLAQRGSFRKMKEDKETSSPLEQKPEQIDHAERMNIWFQPKNLKHIEPFISGEVRSIQEFPTYNFTNRATDDLKQLLDFFKKKEYQVMYRELISPELKLATEGLSVVMVKVPKFVPLYLEEDFRSIGAERLYSVPEQLGRKVDRTAKDPFTNLPHPFP